MATGRITKLRQAYLIRGGWGRGFRRAPESIAKDLGASHGAADVPRHSHCHMESLPTIKQMRVIPVAGYDSFLLNLSGGHGPVFIRNLVVLEDNAGHTGVGETPGRRSDSRRRSRRASELVVGRRVGEMNDVLQTMAARFARAGCGRPRQCRRLTSG